MPAFNVLLTDYAWDDLDIEREILSRIDARLLVAENSDAASLVALAPQADAILTCWAQVPSAVIAAAPRCRIIARLGIGLDNIDVDFATSRRIVVTNVPDYCLTEVAEHSLALILALARKVAWYHLATKQGRYNLHDGPPLARLAGKTLGIVGLGSIGRELARRALALGMRVVATSRRRHRPLEGVAWRSLEELLAESDYVSLHVPSTPDTRHLIGAPQLELMKPTACLINTARGALVDEAALAAALAAGKIAGAALDVQQQEPPPLDSPPLNDPRVIVTPHAAFASTESLIELRTRAARQVADRLSGQRPENVVNPGALE